MTTSSYLRLGITLLISLIVMWVLSMTMIDQWGHFYFNMSNLWIAVVMVAAMALIMMVSMHSMFENKRLNIALYIGFAVLFVAGVMGARTSTFIGNDQFLRSMIPHHSRAILMCQESTITDPQIKSLCQEIISSQRKEIREMEQILDSK